VEQARPPTTCPRSRKRLASHEERRDRFRIARDDY
jgi:hypothetical protein